MWRLLTAFFLLAAVAACTAAKQADPESSIIPALALKQEPEPPKPLPEELLGLTPAVIQKTLGAPTLVRREGTAQVMQYRADVCILDVTLYEDDADRYFRADHVSARATDGGPHTSSDCLAALLPGGYWPEDFPNRPAAQPQSVSLPEPLLNGLVPAAGSDSDAEAVELYRPDFDFPIADAPIITRPAARPRLILPVPDSDRGD